MYIFTSSVNTSAMYVILLLLGSILLIITPSGGSPVPNPQLIVRSQSELFANQPGRQIDLSKVLPTQELFWLNLEEGYFACQLNSSEQFLKIFRLSRLCDGVGDCYQDSDELRKDLKCSEGCDGNCSGNGVCLLSRPESQCHCDDGWGGLECESADVNECKYRPCSLMADCTNTLGSYYCTCREGYSGDGFNCRREEDGDEYEDENTILPSTLDTKTCTFQGRVYSDNEEVITQKKCQSCRCSGGKIICGDVSCPLSPLAGACAPILSGEKCCPDYDCTGLYTTQGTLPISKEGTGVDSRFDDVIETLKNVINTFNPNQTESVSTTTTVRPALMIVDVSTVSRGETTTESVIILNSSERTEPAAGEESRDGTPDSSGAAATTITLPESDGSEKPTSLTTDYTTSGPTNQIFLFPFPSNAGELDNAVIMAGDDTVTKDGFVLSMRKPVDPVSGEPDVSVKFTFSNSSEVVTAKNEVDPMVSMNGNDGVDNSMDELPYVSTSSDEIDTVEDAAIIDDDDSTLGDVGVETLSETDVVDVIINGADDQYQESQNENVDTGVIMDDNDAPKNPDVVSIISAADDNDNMVISETDASNQDPVKDFRPEVSDNINNENRPPQPREELSGRNPLQPKEEFSSDGPIFPVADYDTDIINGDGVSISEGDLEEIGDEPSNGDTVVQPTKGESFVEGDFDHSMDNASSVSGNEAEVIVNESSAADSDITIDNEGLDDFSTVDYDSDKIANDDTSVVTGGDEEVVVDSPAVEYGGDLITEIDSSVGDSDIALNVEDVPGVEDYDVEANTSEDPLVEQYPVAESPSEERDATAINISGQSGSSTPASILEEPLDTTVVMDNSDIPIEESDPDSGGLVPITTTTTTTESDVSPSGSQTSSTAQNSVDKKSANSSVGSGEPGETENSSQGENNGDNGQDNLVAENTAAEKEKSDQDGDIPGEIFADKPVVEGEDDSAVIESEAGAAVTEAVIGSDDDGSGDSTTDITGIHINSSPGPSSVSTTGLVSESTSTEASTDIFTSLSEESSSTLSSEAKTEAATKSDFVPPVSEATEIPDSGSTVSLPTTISSLESRSTASTAVITSTLTSFNSASTSTPKAFSSQVTGSTSTQSSDSVPTSSEPISTSSSGTNSPTPTPTTTLFVSSTSSIATTAETPLQESAGEEGESNADLVGTGLNEGESSGEDGATQLKSKTDPSGTTNDVYDDDTVDVNSLYDDDSGDDITTTTPDSPPAYNIGNANTGTTEVVGGSGANGFITDTDTSTTPATRIAASTTTSEESILDNSTTFSSSSSSTVNVFNLPTDPFAGEKYSPTASTESLLEDPSSESSSASGDSPPEFILPKDSISTESPTLPEKTGSTAASVTKSSQTTASIDFAEVTTSLPVVATTLRSSLVTIYVEDIIPAIRPGIISNVDDSSISGEVPKSAAPENATSKGSTYGDIDVAKFSTTDSIEMSTNLPSTISSAAPVASTAPSKAPNFSTFAPEVTSAISNVLTAAPEIPSREGAITGSDVPSEFSTNTAEVSTTPFEVSTKVDEVSTTAHVFSTFTTGGSSSENEDSTAENEYATSSIRDSTPASEVSTPSTQVTTTSEVDVSTAATESPWRPGEFDDVKDVENGDKGRFDLEPRKDDSLIIEECDSAQYPSEFYSFAGKTTWNTADCSWDFFRCTERYGTWPDNRLCCELRFNLCNKRVAERKQLGRTAAAAAAGQLENSGASAAEVRPPPPAARLDDTALEGDDEDDSVGDSGSSSSITENSGSIGINRPNTSQAVGRKLSLIECIWSFMGCREKNGKLEKDCRQTFSYCSSSSQTRDGEEGSESPGLPDFEGLDKTDDGYLRCIVQLYNCSEIGPNPTCQTEFEVCSQSNALDNNSGIRSSSTSSSSSSSTSSSSSSSSSTSSDGTPSIADGAGKVPEIQCMWSFFQCRGDTATCKQEHEDCVSGNNYDNKICTGVARNPQRYLVPHPTDCTKFYSCQRRGWGGWIAHPMDCPPTTGFDTNLMVCNYINALPRCVEEEESKRLYEQEEGGIVARQTRNRHIQESVDIAQLGYLATQIESQGAQVKSYLPVLVLAQLLLLRTM